MSRNRKGAKPPVNPPTDEPTDKAPAKPSAFKPPPCPTCGSEDTFVYTTRPYPNGRGWKMRYCKCNACGETYSKTGPPQLNVRIEDDPEPGDPGDEGLDSLLEGEQNEAA